MLDFRKYPKLARTDFC